MFGCVALFARETSCQFQSLNPIVFISQDRLFGKLALDVDRRVRLVTQSVHLFIVSIAKRKIAPHLKSMIGPWLICFFDPSKDVARIASTSFSVSHDRCPFYVPIDLLNKKPLVCISSGEEEGSACFLSEIYH
jgi:hypothetical protein